MKLTSRICPDPVIYTEPSEPAMAHSIGEHQTIGLEEVDVFFGTGNRKAAVRAIINDGYTPDGQWARVRNGQTHRICTFGPMMMAGLDKVESGTSGVMSATLSRCIRDQDAPGTGGLPAAEVGPAGDGGREADQRAADSVGPAGARPAGNVDPGRCPRASANREAELWEPLIAVADIAGGPWPEHGPGRGRGAHRHGRDAAGG